MLFAKIRPRVLLHLGCGLQSAVRLGCGLQSTVHLGCGLQSAVRLGCGLQSAVCLSYGVSDQIFVGLILFIHPKKECKMKVLFHCLSSMISLLESLLTQLTLNSITHIVLSYKLHMIRVSKEKQNVN